MDEFKFKELIDKFERGELSAQQQNLLNEWLSREENGTRPLWTDTQHNNLKEKLFEQIDNLEKGDMRLSFKDGEAELPRRRTVNAWLRIAVAVIIFTLSVLSYFAWPWGDATSISFAKDPVRKIILMDGSIVWLKGDNSKLIFPDFTLYKRHLKLEGEALFEISKDADHPFTIECDGILTKVVGTSFNIKSEENVEICVLTGIVSVTGHDKQSVEVKPREKAVFNKGRQKLTKASLNDSEMTTIIDGTTYDMRFEDAKVLEIVKRVETKFNLRIAVTDPAINSLKVSADFTDLSLDRTMDMLTNILGRSYRRQGNIIFLQ